MAGRPQHPVLLQKPPGYRDPSHPVQPGMRPPPRMPVLPPSFKPRRRRRSCCRVNRLICCFLVLLLLLVALGLTVFYLWFQPSLPVFHLQSFQIPLLDVKAKTDGTYLDAQTVSTFVVNNPNRKLSLFYKQSNVAVTFGEDETKVGSEELPKFTQKKSSTTSLKVETGVTNQRVDGEEGNRLKAGFQSKELMVKMEIRIAVGFLLDALRIGPLEMKVLCDGVSLMALEAGATHKCTLDTLKWINVH
ncbi:NDR1/HIN1-like protein 6 [Carya illinoinensis]|uniref:Late embryogenesis abundant protein LEA-2 subgroup domain-containing protein n=1 Tax=Carya illinoinensis TaxID=32201 RepID=A0A8T1RC16_CARIL|nr:NDR1/HIN1-like protein 6 [Carya illinoinensis]KAG6663631.1 hypothetical protein CIPAW_02G038200 [Carya illinoinensis]KAG6663632.1 hypothetical protein CIPAW_02G038200 [Carya illinoinensis]